MKRLTHWIIGCLLLISAQVTAQVSFVFLPEVQGRTMDGLFQVRIAGTAAQRLVASLQITVTAPKEGRIVTIKTKPFEVKPGVNPLPPGLIAGAGINFGNNKIATICRQSGYFTEGDYEYCFELLDEGGHTGETLGMQCFDYYLQPFSPLLLSSPADEDDICDKRPSLYWQPLLPAIPGLQYRLVLAEWKPDQAKVEALRYNFPVINQQYINLPMLFFPPSAKALEEGHQYVWQVTAYKEGMILATSEIWTFKVSCTDSVKPFTPESFRDIRDLDKGNFYVARGKVLFALQNIYAKTTLQYQITGITDPKKVIRKLPEVKLENGNNHVIIDISDNRSFVDGYYYQLTVKLPDGEVKQLRFLYKSETE
ncbi:DUF928 domain-containing protein [Chitinophaga ginsengisegetis]|uniref:DUF928 domain-containing protein n=1 Tax=Chitinophaga ginsengisegetis TaxID=393003 RepID=UPI000DBA3670|nr:DUF928 domain-containing protein [Chitinophaga ginsengisegetis]MDR6571167.1 hypothetical protein [Chitinophaga ginsengisegetis]MDR6650901.1 hypothetical protein [Chitinophaga ginsengisegetis]MDR6657212.1 hypothetical protein [Chitinophaga ginsengisegetis]